MSSDVFKNYYNNVCTKLNKKIDDINNQSEIDNDLINYNVKLFGNLNSDGKLVRGTLVNLGYNLIVDDNLDYSYDLALAFEVFQTAILVHDDIIDNADLRRGKETIHSKNYKKYYKLSGNEKESKKVSESIALCMGDMGLYFSNRIISSAYMNDKNLGKVLTYFNDVVLNTIKGELLDVILPVLEHNNESENLYDNIMLIYKLKTAYYTIIGPLCSGMLLAGASDEQVNDIVNFGYNVGVAFQIQDDILGIYSNNESLLKNVGSDVEEFKQTILYSYVKEQNEYYDELMKYYGKKINAKQLTKVQEIFTKSGALDYANSMVEKLFNEALKILDNIDWISDDKKEILNGFVLYLMNRKK